MLALLLSIVLQAAAEPKIAVILSPDKPVVREKRVTCTTIELTNTGHVFLECGAGHFIMYQWGHWPEVWEGGPVLGGQHQAQIVDGEIEVVDRIIEEGQSLTIGGRLVPIRSEMKLVEFPETEDERKMRFTRSGRRPALQGIPWLKN